MEAAREDGVEEIRASGGLVVRDGRVVVVHRPEYDDWSFPKGKADPGESDEDCALREIEEETGLRCELGEELTTTRHRDTKGRPKRVRWWLMRPLSGEFEPTRRGRRPALADARGGAGAAHVRARRRAAGRSVLAL